MEPAVGHALLADMRIVPALASCILASSLLTGCASAVYSALEQVGIEKRDVLVNRVSAARDAQEDAKEEFASALDQFRSMVKIDGGELEGTYDRLNSAYERSREGAEEVRDRIETVETVAEDLFEEWEDELDEYQSAELRRDSKQLLTETRRRYSTLIRAMREAEKSMGPVLEIFEDQVLVLKHNLNAQAIGSLRRELGSIEKRTAVLIKEMEQSIAEANEFIEGMKAG